MNTHILIEIIGYIGSAFVLISFLMSSVVKLRVLNMVGGFIFGTYALLIQSYPTAIMQLCLILINLYYLVQLKRDNHQFDLIPGEKEESFFQYMIEHYRDDIKTYFPNMEESLKMADIGFLVCCNAIPAGIFLGKKKGENSIEIICDYSTPTYRDCSVGKYLYLKLQEQGIQTLIFPGSGGNHEVYLKKMGFIKEENSYIKFLGADECNS